MIRFLQSGICVALCAFTVAAFAQVENPFIGTWDLDREDSDFGNVPQPENMSRTYADLGGGSYMYLVANLTPDGSLGGSSATYKYDGDQYPIASLTALDPAYISYQKINERTVEYRVSVNGELSQIGAKTISNDGRVLTIVIQYPNSSQENQILRFDRRRQ